MVLRRSFLQLLIGAAVAAIGTSAAQAQTSYTSTSATTAWDASRWNNTLDAAPYTSAFTANNAVSFTSGTYSFAGMGANINVGNINVANGVSVNFASIGNTFQTNGAVRTITVGAGGTFDFQGLAISTAAGTGFIKSGSGVLALSGSTYTGGFTLNSGTIIARGVNAMGGGTGHVLRLNGGTVASNGTRTFDSTKYVGGIVIGGDVQFGELSTVVSLASSTANLSFANNVNLNGATRTLTIGNNGTQTFSGIVSNGGLSVAAGTGAGGSLVLSGVNTYSGGTTVSGGTLVLGNATNTLANGGAINVNGGTLSIGANSDTVGAVTLTSGSITGSSGILTGTGTAYDVRSGSVSAILGGIVGLTKSTAGTVTLSGVNTYSGGTTISDGTLVLGNATNTLANGGAINVDGGTLSIGANSDTVGAVTLTSGSITGSGGTLTGTGSAYDVRSGSASAILGGIVGLTKSTAGTVTLTGANSYAGTTSIDVGVLNVQNATALGTTVGGTSVASGAALQVQGGIAVGAEALTLNGTGVSNTGALRNISGTNTYGGLVTLGSSSQINSDAGTLSLSNTGTISGSGFGLTVGGAGNTSVSSIIGTGTGGLTKLDGGTLTLNGANTYTGATTVSGGELVVAGSLASETFTVASGATLTSAGGLNATVGTSTINGTTGGAGLFTVGSGATLAGSGTILNDLVLNGVLAPGNSIGTLNAGNTTWNDGTPWVFELGAGNTSDLLNINGNFTKGTGTLFEFNFGGSTEIGTFTLVDWTGTTGFNIGDFTYTGLAGGNTGAFGFSGSRLDFTVTAVPELSSIALVALAGAGVGAYRLARRKRKAAVAVLLPVGFNAAF